MARCRLGLVAALVALPGARGSEGSGSPNSVTVWLLVLLLLLLLAALALAWYHLNRESGGHYHPTRLGSSLGRRARRLLRASGLTRWLRGSAVEELQDSVEKQEDEDEDEEEEEEEEEEEDLEPDGEHGQQPEQKPEDGGPGGSQGLEASGGEAKEGPQAQPSEAGGSAGSSSGTQPSEARGSAGALLSDLHAFSGSAAWEDGAGTEGGHGLSVTAL
ncbi:protein tyrosine phosphatase receptor type C-associated protein isoform X2 [Antechinus flavipes]|uniref:protein tyrosine phosphatase receptor type C-associated protein isoform X2 n=1 Tax=Antechinus flavipes TaxID=38775 RepID=UPI0022369DF0|nr:protein tyrosine phosphatase receptor type C-associated protein isoform X2 [Antechinus flavipes]